MAGISLNNFKVLLGKITGMGCWGGLTTDMSNTLHIPVTFLELT